MKRIVEEVSSRWEEVINRISRGDDYALVFLELSYYDLITAAKNIDCPYCRRHMILEAEEIKRVIRKIEEYKNREHMHGAFERLKSLITALKITIFIILGGLRRAGII